MIYLCKMAVCALVMIAVFTLLATASQELPIQRPSDIHTGSASLQGHIQDSRGQAISAATIVLRSSTQTLTALTDAEGTYRFSELPADVYTLRAEMPGYNETTLDPCVLGASEMKQIDLTLVSTAQSG